MTQWQKFLNVLVNPTVAMILGALGLAGLFFEITHPGFGFPGAAGLVCLFLSIFAFHLLPIKYLGLILIIASIALFIAEVKVQSFGLLTLAGIICFIFGASSLIEAPDPFIGISIAVIIIVSISMALFTLFLGYLVLKAHQRRTETGETGLLGKVGKAATDIISGNEPGKIFIHGEYWNAFLEKESPTIAKGDLVVVTKAEGLTLTVKPHKEK